MERYVCWGRLIQEGNESLRVFLHLLFCLATEESNDDITSFISSECFEDLTDEEEQEEEYESVASTQSKVNDFPAAIQSIHDLTTFVSLRGDTEALQHLTRLRLHFEKMATSTTALKQTTISSFF